MKHCCLILLCIGTLTGFSQTATGTSLDSTSGKRAILHVTLHPVGYVTLFQHLKSGPVTSYPSTSYTSTQTDGSGGLHLQLGPCINKQYYIALGSGIEGTWDRVFVPVYVDVSINLLKRKISPTINAGGGYFSETFRDKWNKKLKSNHGGHIYAGIGASFHLKPGFSITLNAGYRMVYLEKLVPPQPLPPNEFLYEDSGHTISHQVGLTVGFVFYQKKN